MRPFTLSRPISPTTRMVLVAFAAVMLIGFFFRITTVLGTVVEAPLRADAGQYYSYAYNLWHHGTYSADPGGISSEVSPAPGYLRNPGYPLLLIPFISPSPNDKSLLNITLFQALLSTAVIMLAYLAALLIMPRASAIGVALLTAISPHLINANVYILSETFASFTTMLFLLSLIYYGTNSQHTKAWEWLACGALLGVATLVRPTMQWFLIPTLFLVFFIPTDNHRKSTLLVLVGFVLVMSPWWIRNLYQFGQMSDHSLMISTLQHGMYPNFMYEGRPETFGFPYRFDPLTAEITRSLSTVLAEIGRRFIEFPKEHLDWYLFGKPVMFWNWDNSAQGAGDVFIYPVTQTPFLTNLPLYLTHELMYWLHWPLVALGMLGSLISWLPSTTKLLGHHSAWSFRVCSTLLIYFVVLHMVGAPFPRYSIPILPALYLQAGGMLTMIYRFMDSRRS